MRCKRKAVITPTECKILIAEPLDFSPRALAILQNCAQVELRRLAREDYPRALAEFDVVWFRLAHRLDAALLQSATRCRFLAVPATGTDHIDHAACGRLGIQIVSLKGETDFLRSVPATAELTIGLALALMRKIPQAHADVQAGRWDRDSFRGRELHGKTIGLVGVGRLGTLVANYFRAFGARVRGYDPRPDFPSQVAERASSLRELLTDADIVSIHAVYDEQTRRLLGPREFDWIKPGAVLINTSRGGILDETALLATLKQGRLAGAALDVLDGEPDIDATHPVVIYAREHDNVLIVPHIGGNTVESFERTEVFLAEKLVACLTTARANAVT